MLVLSVGFTLDELVDTLALPLDVVYQIMVGK